MMMSRKSRIILNLKKTIEKWNRTKNNQQTDCWRDKTDIHQDMSSGM